MADLITLYKPNGQEIRVNENSLEHALKVLKWTKDRPAQKRGRKPLEPKG